ncbi:hypothetical protein ACN3XK_74365, partial [Actinomadura welshii]
TTWPGPDGLEMVGGRDPVQSGGIAADAGVSDALRTELKTKLQQRWEQALDERAEPTPGSSLPVLSELLAARRERQGPVVSLRSA